MKLGFFAANYAHLSLEEVAKIQAEGRQKRQAAEAELARIEGELKDKLLDIRQ